MHISFSQLSFADVYSECHNLFVDDTPAFFKLLNQHLSISEFIPSSFYSAFYQRFGRKRKYHLEAFLSALIFQKIASIPTDALLLLLLSLCKELRDFCGFKKVPDASKLTRFKQDFEPFIEAMFQSLVDYTEPLCQVIDKELASMLVFDTSGIEVYVNENNPKFLNKKIKQLKAFHRSLGNDAHFDPYKKAYTSMPDAATSNPSAKQMYINGHFCYAHKFAIATNGLGIPRHIAFLDEDFKQSHDTFSPNDDDNPETSKSIGDSTCLQPVLTDFFNQHPTLSSTTFLADSAFDSFDHYDFLKNTCRFKRALIPLNQRNTSTLPEVGYNEYGYPLCPNDESLVMKRCGITKEKGRSPRVKWICPKVHIVNGARVCDCDSPCSSAKYGRTTYTHTALTFRDYPGIARGSIQWDELYKKRGVVEQTIQHFKSSMCVANRKTSNLTTTKADVFLAGITSLLTVVLASRIKQPQYARSLKPLIA